MPTSQEQIDILFAKLEAVKDQEWILKNRRMIRTKDGCCPIEAAYGLPPGGWTCITPSADIPINRELPTIQGMISHVADHRDCFYKEYDEVYQDMEGLRQRMLDLLKPKLEE